MQGRVDGRQVWEAHSCLRICRKHSVNVRTTNAQESGTWRGSGRRSEGARHHPRASSAVWAPPLQVSRLPGSSREPQIPPLYPYSSWCLNSSGLNPRAACTGLDHGLDPTQGGGAPPALRLKPNPVQPRPSPAPSGFSPVGRAPWRRRGRRRAQQQRPKGGAQGTHRGALSGGTPGHPAQVLE